MRPVPHDFRDPSLLDLALTHASTGSEEDNERLEFLGDAVLDLVVAEELYRCGLDRSEGEMTELKAWVVSRRVLAEAARELGLEGQAKLGHGMRGRILPRSVLANLYEAVFGAVYLDAGLEAARTVVVPILEEALAERSRRLPSDPKTFLQEAVQARGWNLPEYRLPGESGPDHRKLFEVECWVDGQLAGRAEGPSKKRAEQGAAGATLVNLELLEEP